MNRSTNYEDGGVGALFDFSFNRFVTLSIIKILYILGMLVIGLGWLGLVISSMARGGAAGFIGSIVVGTLVAIIYLISYRVWLEIVVVIFRIGQNTSRLVELQGGASTAAPVTTTPPATPPTHES